MCGRKGCYTEEGQDFPRKVLTSMIDFNDSLHCCIEKYHQSNSCYNLFADFVKSTKQHTQVVQIGDAYALMLLCKVARRHPRSYPVILNELYYIHVFMSGHGISSR